MISKEDKEKYNKIKDKFTKYPKTTFIQETPTPLPSELEEVMTKQDMLDLSTDEILQYIQSMQDEIELGKKVAKECIGHINDNIKLESKLNKINKYIRAELCCGIVYDKLQSILKENK